MVRMRAWQRAELFAYLEVVHADVAAVLHVSVGGDHDALRR